MDYMIYHYRLFTGFRYNHRIMRLKTTCPSRRPQTSNHKHQTTTTREINSVSPRILKRLTHLAMDNLSSPSLLDYVRFHGIAMPADTTCPLDCLNTPTDRPCEDDASPNHDHLSVFENHLSTIEQELHAERLNLGKKDALFLSATARGARTNHTDINWDNYLPSMRQIESLRVEMPALMTHHETDLALLKQHAFFSRRDVVSSLLRGSLSYPLVPEDSSDGFQEPGLEVIETLKRERLNCSSGSLGLIQNAMRCGDIGPSDGSFYKTVLRPYQKRLYEPEHPIKTLDIDQFYSPPRTPKPQMLPSPVSSDPVDQSGMKDKTLIPNSVPFSLGHTGRSGILNLEVGNGQPSIIPPEGEFGSPSDTCPPSCGQSSDVTSMSNKSNHGLEHTTEPIIHVHPAVQEKTHSDVACSPELDFGGQPLLKGFFSSPVQPTLLSTSIESHGNKEVHPALSGPTSARDSQSVDGLGLADPSEVQVDIRVVDKEHLQNHEDHNKNSIMSQDVTLVSSMNDPISPRSNRETERISTTTCFKDNTGFPDQTEPIEVPPASSYTPDQQGEWYSAPSHKRPKRKNKRRDSSSRKHQRRPEHGKTKALPQAILDKSVLSSPFTELGSLSAFMETRGRISTRRVNAKSPYFAEERVSVVQQSHIANATDTCPKPNKQGQEVDISTKLAPQYIPGYPKNNPEPVLIFLSTSLLKSHLGLVRVLESKKDPTPTLIYRDYDNHVHGHQNEADIIVSPSSAILLTTSQATTQLYLPGHKPSHPQLDGIKGVNSPLRERIVLLAPRYDRLYVLVCHTGSITTGKPGPTADKRTLESMVSLTAFCNSLSGYSAVIPLIITPSTPETVAEWALSLAYKHSFQLSVGRSTNDFTPSNPGSNTSTRLEPASMETETQWERFLRYAGLNPFAAHAILAVLKREDNNNPNSMEVSDLSRLIEMSTEHRRRVFAGIIGDKVLDRVEAVIEQDWQCDWALDFNAIM